MKLSLTNRSVCPPDGFRFCFPDDGYVVHDWTYDGWVAGANAHLSANNLSRNGELSVEMEDQLCQSLPPGWCNYDDPNRPRPTLSLGWGDVVNGLKTFSTWIAGGCRFVDQKEADRRALVCSRCYLNVNVQGCGACTKIVQEVTGNRKTKYDFALRSCGVCHCFLRAKVHFPLEVMKKSTEGLQDKYGQVSWCWLNKASENYVPDSD